MGRNAFIVVAVVVVLLGLHMLIKPPQGLPFFSDSQEGQRVTARAVAAPYGDSVTGRVVAQESGCCTRFCQQSSRAQCPWDGEFVANRQCAELDACNVGCCVDDDFYCFTNYLKGNCLRNDFSFIRNMCNEIFDCVTPHVDKPYTCYAGFGLPDLSQFDCRQIDLPDSYLRVLPPTGKKATFFTLGYYLYGEQSVRSVRLVLRNQEGVVLGNVAIFDDGAHNDGAPQDGYFAGVWSSAAVPDGMQYVDIEIITVDNGGVVSSKTHPNAFLVVGGADCVPLAAYRNMEHDNVIDVVFVGREFVESRSNFPSAVVHGADVIDRAASVLGSQKPLAYFRIDTPLQGVLTGVRSKAVQECGIDGQGDLVILFDEHEPYCRAEPGIVTVNPRFSFGDLGSFSTEELLNSARFCDHVLTSQLLLDRIIEENTPPVIAFAPARGEPLTESMEIPYTVSDNQDVQVHVEFSFNDVEFPALSRSVPVDVVQFVRIPCLRGGEVHRLTAYVTDNDENTREQTITIDAGSGAGFNEQGCPPGVPRDVWYGSDHPPESAGASIGSPFDTARLQTCVLTLDADPICCLNRGNWVVHEIDGFTYGSCEDVRCGAGFPACPTDRYCAEDGLCR